MAKREGDSSDFSIVSVILRLFAALALVLATFNPSGYSAYHWISEAVAAGAFGPLHLLAIGLLLIGWTVFWFATWRSLNALGIALIGIVISALVWLLIDWGVISAESATSKTWIALVGLAVILGIGLSWAHIWRRVTGQVSVDHVEE